MLKQMTDDEKKMLQRAEKGEKKITECMDVAIFEKLFRQPTEENWLLARLKMGLIDCGYNVPDSLIEELFAEGFIYVGEMEFKKVRVTEVSVKTEMTPDEFI